MRAFIVGLLFCVAASAQTPILPGGICDGAPAGSTFKEYKSGDTVTLCFDALPSPAAVDYMRVRSAQQLSGSYGEWFRLNSSARGFTFTAKTTRYIGITVVQKELSWESPMSNAVLVKVVP